MPPLTPCLLGTFQNSETGPVPSQVSRAFVPPTAPCSARSRNPGQKLSESWRKREWLFPNPLLAPPLYPASHCRTDRRTERQTGTVGSSTRLQSRDEGHLSAKFILHLYPSTHHHLESLNLGGLHRDPWRSRALTVSAGLDFGNPRTSKGAVPKRNPLSTLKTY